MTAYTPGPPGSAASSVSSAVPAAFGLTSVPPTPLPLGVASLESRRFAHHSRTNDQAPSLPPSSHDCPASPPHPALRYRSPPRPLGIPRTPEKSYVPLAHGGSPDAHW